MNFQSSICRSFHFKDPSTRKTSTPVGKNLLEWNTSGSQQKKFTKLTLMEHHWNMFLGLFKNNWQKPSTNQQKLNRKLAKLANGFFKIMGPSGLAAMNSHGAMGPCLEQNVCLG